ncbi:unnamed protein product [Mytilus coruscus]|uniref:Uncharacterized protein n=1 Tax=Mytilus coruscus TaxID=42192 RepID=A0A6J8EAU0_MYTCO|nr:unnamed protein product [Mytilus coruscus]
MALGVRFNNYNLEVTSTCCTVPDNPISKLMYYLNSVCTVVDLRNSIPGLERLTNYMAYRNITDRELLLLIRLCELLSPMILIDKVFFRNARLCGDSLNRFYNLRTIQHTIAAARSIVVGNRRVSVNKIMVYQPTWFQNNYYGPLRFIKVLLNM